MASKDGKREPVEVCIVWRPEIVDESFDLEDLPEHTQFGRIRADYLDADEPIRKEVGWLLSDLAFFIKTNARYRKATEDLIIQALREKEAAAARRRSIEAHPHTRHSNS